MANKSLYLVPTTILAFQHFKTFSERLKDFPVTVVDYLNRFRTTKQRKDSHRRVERWKCRYCHWHTSARK